MNVINSSDLLMYVRSVASERGLAYEEVLDVFADALAQSLRKTSSDYREADFRVKIDPDSGKADAFRRWRVLDEEEEMENPQREVVLDSAREKLKEENVNPGDIIEEPLDNVNFNQRTTMQSAKQYFNTRLREAERRQLLDDLLSRNEDLVSGQVQRVLRDRGDVIVEVMRVDCRLPRSEMLPREALKVGDRVQAMIKEVDTDSRGQQIILTRISSDFLVRLFQRVVPEIEKGVLEIVAAVRAPGNRAKIAVRTSDSRVDPVGTCVGIRGSRVQAVTSELNGERIDIINWDADDANYVLRALAPAEVAKISVNPERKRMDVLVEPDLMAQAIGKNGINVRLASELTGWDLSLVTPEDFNMGREQIVAKKSALLAEALNLDQEVAQILYDEGFEGPEYVAYAQPSELMEIEGFEADVVDSIQKRAKEVVERKEIELREKLMSVDEQLQTLVEMDEQLLYDLVAEDVLTIENLAELDVDELLEKVEIPSARAGNLIMSARAVLDGEQADESETDSQ